MTPTIIPKQKSKVMNVSKNTESKLFSSKNNSVQEITVDVKSEITILNGNVKLNHSVQEITMDVKSKTSILNGDVELDMLYLIYLNYDDSGKIVDDYENYGYQNIKYLGNQWKSFEDFKTHMMQLSGVDIEKEIDESVSKVNLDDIIEYGKKYHSQVCSFMNNKWGWLQD